MRLFKFLRRKPRFKLHNDHIVKEAFECKGEMYYCFEDIFSLPYERALTALDFYEEFRMRTTYDFLKLHVKAVNDLLNNPKAVRVGDIALLNKQLEERLNWIISPDLLYKLASVVFFDKNESPYIYDHKYGAKKIALWKKNYEMNAFFLQQPMIRLLPFLQDCEIDFQGYSIVAQKATKLHLENIITNMSVETKNSDSVKESISRQETLQN